MACYVISCRKIAKTLKFRKSLISLYDLGSWLEKSPKNGSHNRDLLKYLHIYGIYWVLPGESPCPDGSEYVWQRGVECYGRPKLTRERKKPLAVLEKAWRSQFSIFKRWSLFKFFFKKVKVAFVCFCRTFLFLVRNWPHTSPPKLLSVEVTRTTSRNVFQIKIYYYPDFSNQRMETKSEMTTWLCTSLSSLPFKHSTTSTWIF